jgi:hypothetical protein
MEPQMNIRVYFNVKYSEKDKAKELGCRWDNERKKWYRLVPILRPLGVLSFWH